MAIYNYRSDEIVQDVVCKYLYTISEDIIENFDSLKRYQSISLYAPFYITKIILNDLMDELCLTIDEESFYFNTFKDKDNVLLTLSNDGYTIIEPADHDGVYLSSDENVVLTYIYDSFTNKEINEINKKIYSTLVFGIDNEDILKNECYFCFEKIDSAFNDIHNSLNELQEMIWSFKK